MVVSRFLTSSFLEDMDDSILLSLREDFSGVSGYLEKHRECRCYICRKSFKCNMGLAGILCSRMLSVCS